MILRKRGIVYIAQSKSLYESGKVKIGYTTKSLKGRMKDLSTSEKFRAIYARKYDDAQNIETKLHKHFEDDRGRGEYFKIYWGNVAKIMDTLGGTLWHEKMGKKQEDMAQGTEIKEETTAPQNENTLKPPQQKKDKTTYFEDLNLPKRTLVYHEKNLQKGYPLVPGKKQKDKHRCAILYGKTFEVMWKNSRTRKYRDPAPLDALASFLCGCIKKNNGQSWHVEKSGSYRFYVKDENDQWENLFARAKRLREKASLRQRD